METKSDKSRASLPAVTSPNRWLRWLISPQSKRLMLPICGAWILGWDWLLFSTNALSGGLATPIISVIGFFVGGAGTLFFQRRYAGDSWFKAIAKSFVAAIAVGLPWPLAGTVVGGWVLLMSGLGNARNEVLGK